MEEGGGSILGGILRHLGGHLGIILGTSWGILEASKGFGGSVEGLLKVFGGSLEDLWRVFGGSLQGAGRDFGRLSSYIFSREVPSASLACAVLLIDGFWGSLGASREALWAS